ncbi:hypothetical protein GCM10009680_56680 [Streptomyces yatensis]|uniref:Uncharacterized protein n=1 Tax=Streptomyces yatensis TaxID=155177 RepID=A0ABN2IP03_9ACTN
MVIVGRGSHDADKGAVTDGDVRGVRHENLAGVGDMRDDEDGWQSGTWRCRRWVLTEEWRLAGAALWDC